MRTKTATGLPAFEFNFSLVIYREQLNCGSKAFASYDRWGALPCAGLHSAAIIHVTAAKVERPLSFFEQQVGHRCKGSESEGKGLAESDSAQGNPDVSWQEDFGERVEHCKSPELKFTDFHKTWSEGTHSVEFLGRDEALKSTASGWEHCSEYCRTVNKQIFDKVTMRLSIYSTWKVLSQQNQYKQCRYIQSC